MPVIDFLFQLIVFLPLAGFLFAGLFGARMQPKVSEYVTSGLLVLAAFFSWIVFIAVGVSDDGSRSMMLARWIDSGALQIAWSLRLDMLTAVMLVVVNSVSAVVHIYSIGYMSHDAHRPRFFAYLSLFTFAMLMLVTSDNLVQMFFGWEGVGLASYLLIGFWYHKPSANAAAIKAFVVNRVGDFGFALGIFALFMLFGTIDMTTIFSQSAQILPGAYINFIGVQWDAATIICLLLFMGAMGKSAQFLLHTWLPDAMEGPTPVSALIHAATMVTAGVFMVVRLSPIFEFSATALLVVTFFGATTAFFAASVGLVQNDIKRVIAYSTCSQLGYMFVAIGIGAYQIAMFHLFTHAFFKALLFLGAGSVIHAVADEQDMRKMGGLKKHIPVTYWMMIIGTLALTGVGIPALAISSAHIHLGFAGFNSKDAIIEAAFMAHNGLAVYAFWLLVVAALFTSFYSWRLIFMTFHGKSRVSADVLGHIHESPKVMLLPQLFLVIGAIVAGIIFEYFFIGGGVESFWQTAIYTASDNNILQELHHVPIWVKFAPFVMMLLGVVAAWYMYLSRVDFPGRLAASNPGLYRFLLNKWYFDELYDFVFVRPAFALGRLFWKFGDGRIIDGLGPDGVSARVLMITRKVVRLQTGYLYHYAFVVLIGVTALVSWFMFTGGSY